MRAAIEGFIAHLKRMDRSAACKPPILSRILPNRIDQAAAADQLITGDERKCVMPCCGDNDAVKCISLWHRQVERLRGYGCLYQ